MKPLAIFLGIVAVGLAVIFAGLRLTAHPASAQRLSQPLTQAQFVRAGNAVCDRYYRDDPAIFRNPKTVKAFTRDFRLAVPFVDRMEAGLRALVPPPGDAATYRRLLEMLGLQNHAAHAMLHAFETGQIRRGVLIARSTGRLDSHLNSLADKVGLTVCGLSDRQVSERYGKAGGAGVSTANETGGAAAGSEVKAGGAGPVRLDGRYTTVTEVVAVSNNTAVYPGERSRRTWTFIPRCAWGGCVTTVLRPSILPGSKRIYRYTLRPIGRKTYRGRLSEPASCQILKRNGRVSTLPNSFTDHTTLTVHVTRIRGGRVTAYDGTFLFRSVPQAAARRHGCTATGHQWITFRSVN